jgi:polyphosphate kinase
MYRGYEVLAHAAFRVTRNSNLYFEEEETRSLLESIRSELHNRRKGDAVRLEIVTGRPSGDRRQAARQLRARRVAGLPRRWPGESGATDVLLRRHPAAGSKIPPFTPNSCNLSRKVSDLFEDLRQRDILLHHPYDSYDPVVASSSRERWTRASSR